MNKTKFDVLSPAEALVVPVRAAYSYRETGLLLDVSERTVWELVRRGPLRAITVGARSRRVPKSEIERYVAAALEEKSAASIPRLPSARSGTNEPLG